MKARVAAATPAQVAAYPGPGRGAIVRHPASGKTRMVVVNAGPSYRLITPVGKGAADDRARWSHHSTLTLQ